MKFPEITSSKNAEYYLSIVQSGAHSFLLLGVIDKDGQARTLARFGKEAHPDDMNNQFCHDRLKIAIHGTRGLVKNEIKRDRRSKIPLRIPINYKAYSLSYEQYNEFIDLMLSIKQFQLAEGYDLTISYYKRKEETSEYRQFEFVENARFNTCELKEREINIAEHASSLNRNNTCRTTAKEIMGEILKFEPQVSGHFYSRPSYKSRLINGDIDTRSLYILPPPPNVYEDLDELQSKLLNKIYQRLEKIPNLAHESDLSHGKFEALKKIYCKIAGKNQIDAHSLLEKINRYEEKHKNILFKQRVPDLLIKLGFFTTRTERLFREIKRDLNLECTSF